MNNDWAKGGSLTLRAIGLMTYILTLPADTPLSARSISTEFSEVGRDAVRTCLDELERAGLIERHGKGTAMRWSLILADDKAKAVLADDKANEILADSANVLAGDKASDPILADSANILADGEANALADSGQFLADSQSVSSSPRRGEEESRECEVAAATSEIVDSETREGPDAQAIDHHAKPVEDVSTEAAAVTDSHIPWTEVHLLRSWFRIEEPTTVEAWQQAWRTATATNGETGYDVQIDLNAYLVRCRAEGRQPSASNWLRFLIQDRTKWVSDQRHHADLQEQRASADGGMEWALRSLSKTPVWNIDTMEGRQE